MKKILTIALTVLVFLSAVLVGVSNVYRVENVVLEVKTYSEIAKKEARQIQQDLQDAYRGESVLFAKEDAAREVIENYPYFRLTKFEKLKPDVLRVELAEDEEVFAVKTKRGYCILSADGTVLDVRKNSENRADGEQNVEIVGANPVGEIGDTVGGAGFDSLLRMCKVMARRLNGIRANVAKIEFDNVEEGGRIFLHMREGVRITVVHAHLLTEQKAEAFTTAYLALGDEQRLTGFIHATESLDGTEVAILYKPNELL